MSELLDKLLAKPVGPSVSRGPSKANLTRQIEVKGDTAEVVIADENADDGTARSFLESEGLNPSEWVATGFRKTEWDGKTAVRFVFARRPGGERPSLDELLGTVKRHKPKANRPDGDHGFLVDLGDMQFGKIDGDGVEGTLNRAIEYIDMAADLLPVYRKRFDIGHIEIGWLGDHVEGFVSQGGANTWRTGLTLNEQIRLTRRVMLYALQVFADEAEQVSMVAVPGNHGETARFAGKGVTRYDDSHDTESLIAVADAAALNPEAFGHVQFYVPQTDELTVVTDVAGTTVAYVHGHFWSPGKHFQWWQGQAFSNPELAAADLLLAGHLHHELVEREGKRLFVQVPSLEGESTWYRHSKGAPGCPGLVVAITKDGKTNPIEVVR